MLGRWIIVGTAFLAACCNPVLAAWTSFQASSITAAPPAVTCNFQTGVATGVGASTCVNPTSTCDGTTDNTAAFAAFANWAINTWQVSHVGQIELFIPSGLTCTLDTANITFNGVLNLLVSGYGATLKSQVNGYFHLGSAAMFQDSAHSVRLNAANAGDTTITVNPASATQPSPTIGGCSTIAACTALFTVGNIAIISGFDQQAGIGTPNNPFYFEFITPTNINSSTGAITLAAPLKFSYKTTWPQFGFGGGTLGNSQDYGGPATLYAMPASFNATFEYDGLTFVQFNSGNAEADLVGTNVTIKDATWTFNGQGCFFPTQSVNVTLINVTATNCTMEADKIIDNFTMINSTWDQIGFESSALHHFTMTGSTINATGGNGLVGTPLNTTISNSTITGTMDPGPIHYGRMDTLTVSNSTINHIASPSNDSYGGVVFDGAHDEGVNNIAGASMSGGVISIPKSYIQANEASLGWATPGNNLCWGDRSGASYDCVQPFQILDVTQSGSNILITTSNPGGFPTWTSQGTLLVRVWPATSVKFTNSTGTDGAAAMLSNADCFGLPLYTCYEVNYTSASSASAAINFWGSWGTISKLEYNVTTAYNGAIGTATLNSGPTFFNNAVNTSLATVAVNPVVNLKAVGDRVLDASAGFPATWSGTQSGDTGVSGTVSAALAAYAAIHDTITDVSGTPGSPPLAVTVKQFTNPGLVIP